MLNFIVSSKHNKTIEIDQRLISPQIQELIWNYALKVLHK